MGHLAKTWGSSSSSGAEGQHSKLYDRIINFQDQKLRKRQRLGGPTTVRWLSEQFPKVFNDGQTKECGWNFPKMSYFRKYVQTMSPN